MRAAFLILYSIGVARAEVVSRDWRDGKLALQLNDGTAEVEWISPVAFRFARSWTGPVEALPKVPHDRIVPELTETASEFTMRTRYLTLDVDRGDLAWRVKPADTLVASGAVAKTSSGVSLPLVLAPAEKIFGLMGGSSGRLNLRGEKLDRRRGFFFTSAGYGIFLRAPARCVFDMERGTVEAPETGSIEFVFYYGPTAKEILEQHAAVVGQAEVMPEALDLLPDDRVPKQAMPLPNSKVSFWGAFDSLVRTLTAWSLSAVLYPAVDLASFDAAPAGLKQRAADLCTFLPIVYRSSGEGGIDRAMRDAWKPYLMTYLHEAHDRGFPMIRPLAMQFSKDPHSDRQANIFMLGDEVLLAPVLDPGAVQEVELPRGIWTDLRTNAEYGGNRVVKVDAPPGRVPMFVRNGWILPLAAQGKMELHYFPSLGGEFFLWEPEVNDNSQFHASPAGDYVRVEIESKVRRTYEWVIHHTPAARQVAEDSTIYRKVDERSLLQPGTWWHDGARNNLHLMVRVQMDSDRIVNISF